MFLVTANWCHASCQFIRYLVSGPNIDSKTPDQAARALAEGLEKTIKRLADDGRNVWPSWPNAIHIR